MVADPARVRDPDRKGSVESAIGHTQGTALKGKRFESIEIDSSPGNAHGIPRTAHSVVTHDLVDREGHPTKVALDRVLSFFRERLL